MASQTGSGSTHCSACACTVFVPNIYRPGLCVSCFHTIAEHATAWSLQGAFFVHATTGARLPVRPADADAALHDAPGRWGATSDGRRGDDDGDGPAPVVGAALQPRVALWEAFTDDRAALRAGSRPAAGVPQPSAPAPSSAPPGTAGRDTQSRAHGDAGAATDAPPPPSAHSPDEDDEDDEDGDAAHPPDAASAPTSAGLHLDAFPDAPSAVPASALINMRFDLVALGDATRRDAAAGAAAARAPSTLEPIVSTLHDTPPTAAEGPAPPAYAIATPPPPAHADGAMRSSPSPSPPPPPPPAAVAVAVAVPVDRSSSAAPGSPPPLPDLLAAHLAPVYGDPLLFNLAELDASLDGALQRLLPAASGGATAARAGGPSALLPAGGGGGGGGVAAFVVRQAFEEDVALPRLLLLTPFTLMAVAAHPTRPGCVVLKWERSLLSLRRLTTQPFVIGGAGTGGGGGPAAPPPAAVATSRKSAGGGGGGGGLRGFFSRLRSSSSSSDGGRGTSVGGDDAHAAPPAAGGSGALLIGLLASFAPESGDTITFLRTFRAGRRPVRREGWLHKRKRSAWREHAPLGPLAWKRRYFVLEPTRLVYYDGAGPAGGGAKLKGVVPLTGWVEVSRAGAEATGGLHDTTTRAHSFLLRTGKTSHVFTAASDAEADEWVAAIAINAQHLGAAFDEPQCVLLPSPADAEALADALARRRRYLVESMSPAGREALGDGAELALDIVTSLPAAVAGAAAGGARGAVGRGAARQRLSAGGSMGGGGGGGGGSGGRGGGAEPLDERALALLAAADGDDGGPVPSPDDVIDGMSVGEALAVVEAAGGASTEVLAQLPPAMAVAVCRVLGAGGRGQPPPPPPTVADGWCYIDDANAQRGPYPAARMREWLFARYFGPATLVRYAAPVDGLDPGCGGDERGAPTAFLPLSVLFSGPDVAFNGDNGAWAPAYRGTMAYQALVGMAGDFGIDPAAVAQAVRTMKESDLPPDLGLLLDMCGVTALPGDGRGGGGSGGSTRAPGPPG